MSDQGSQAVFAILREARDLNQRLTTTALIKYLYLLDVLHARETNGKTWTGWEWRFLHFGPWTAQAKNAIEELAAKRFIEAEACTSREGDKDYTLYSLPSSKSAPSLKEIGVPNGAKVELDAYFNRFNGDLPRLLDFVYFHTEPMADAKLGQVLDFSGCVKTTPSSLKAVQMRPIDKKAVDAFKAKLRANIEDKKKRMKRIAWEGPYDRVYDEGLSELEGEPLPVGLSGKTKISV